MSPQCKVGAVFNDATNSKAWQMAQQCADKLTVQNQTPHFVDSKTYYNDPPAPVVTVYTIVDNSERQCKPGKVYDDYFGNTNETFANECVAALNRIEGKTLYTVEVITRTIFANLYKVVER